MRCCQYWESISKETYTSSYVTSTKVTAHPAIGLFSDYVRKGARIAQRKEKRESRRKTFLRRKYRLSIFRKVAEYNPSLTIAAYSGGELWRMIPSTMRPWWIHSLTETDQDWCQFYRGHIISLALPRPLFDDRTLGMTNFLMDVGSGHPGSLVKGWKNDKEFLPPVMSPFGCSEYCFKGNHVPWDLVIQHLLLKVLPLIHTSSYLHVQHMWDQYDREDHDFDTILLNPEWEIRPSIVISECGCPRVVTCRNHGGGSKFQVLYPPCYPVHHLSVKCTDQLCPIVVQPRIAHTTRAKEFCTTLGMSRQYSNFSGIDSCDVGLNGNSSVTSELLCGHESLALAGRPDLHALLSRKVAENQILQDFASSMNEESIRRHPTQWEWEGHILTWVQKQCFSYKSFHRDPRSPLVALKPLNILKKFRDLYPNEYNLDPGLVYCHLPNTFLGYS
jgi:hypothetical protein